MKWPKCPWSPLLLHCHLSPSLKLWPHPEYPVITWQRKRCRPGLQIILCDMQVLGCSRQWQFYSPCQEHFWRTLEKGNPPSGQNSKQYTWQLTMLERRNGQAYDYIPIYGLWLMVWPGGQGLGRNMSGKLGTRKFREEVRTQVNPWKSSG